MCRSNANPRLFAPFNLMILRCSLGWQRRRPTCSTYDSRVAICHGPCGLLFLFSFFAPSSAFAMIELHVGWTIVCLRDSFLLNRPNPPDIVETTCPLHLARLFTRFPCHGIHDQLSNICTAHVLSDSETPNLVLLGRVVSGEG
jgi:hypothetical protein